MNDVYFACQDCKNYIDAGYRWAAKCLFWNQESRYPILISTDDILANAEYWSGTTANAFLADVLPAARRFLLGHRGHQVVFGDSGSFASYDAPSYSFLEWLDVRALEEKANPARFIFEPRYFAEHTALRYTSWSQVEPYCASIFGGSDDEKAATAVAKHVFLRAVESLSKNEN
jgi:hypothetical protein